MYNIAPQDAPRDKGDLCQLLQYQGAEEIEVEPEVVLHMIYMRFPNQICTVMFFDDGSSCSLITHKLAWFLNGGGWP